ncbi:MAG: CvpA family protein [Eubacterium sp.]
MILDITAIIIIVIAVLRHAFKGFVVSVVHLIQWIAIAILSLLYSDNLKQYLVDHTSIDSGLEAFFKNLLLKRFQESGGTLSLPDFMKNAADTAANTTAEYAASVITGIVMSILALLLIYIGVRIIGSIVIMLFSRSHHGGVIGALDGILGGIAGLILGILYVCILLSLLKLTLPLLAADTQTWLQTQLNASLLASTLYQHNLVVAFFQAIGSGTQQA